MFGISQIPFKCKNFGSDPLVSFPAVFIKRTILENVVMGQKLIIIF
jgi:hypothetical protein